MAATEFSGPLIVSGGQRKLTSAYAGSYVPDPNVDAGPSVLFQGTALPDVRVPISKDRISGKLGAVRGHLSHPYIISVNAIPAALGATKLSAAANTTSGTAVTLAAASAGISTNVPFMTFAGAVVTAAAVLDFGFAWGNVTSGSKNVVVADSSLFWQGMPLVIPNVGNNAGTTALLTYVASVTDATHIALNDAPSATNSFAAIGTGNIWSLAPSTPTAHAPYVAYGTSALLDTAQSISRGVSVTGSSSAVGGAFLISGYDVYGLPQTETLTHSGGAGAVYSQKTYKAIMSVTPQFTDAHNYSIGTSDLFGFAVRNDLWEFNDVYWAGAELTASTGWTAADATSPATTTTKDVRGTIQVSASGPLGSGASSNASNGAASGQSMSGRRLFIASTLPLWNQMQGNIDNAVPVYGVTPV